MYPSTATRLLLAALRITKGITTAGARYSHRADDKDPKETSQLSMLVGSTLNPSPTRFSHLILTTSGRAPAALHA